MSGHLGFISIEVVVEINQRVDGYKRVKRKHTTPTVEPFIVINTNVV